MRGVIYARYSSDNQREESIEGQIRENTAYAKKNGIDIVGTYIDRALSLARQKHAWRNLKRRRKKLSGVSRQKRIRSRRSPRISFCSRCTSSASLI